MTPEGKVKFWLKRQLKRRYPKCKIVSPRGGPFGRAGTADLICCIYGFYVEIEVKTENNDLSPLQRASLFETVNAGGVAAKISGRDELRLAAICDEVDKRYGLYMAGKRGAQTIQSSDNHD